MCQLLKISLNAEKTFYYTYTIAQGGKGGDIGSKIQFLEVSDFGYWLKGNVQEFSSF